MNIEKSIEYKELIIGIKTQIKNSRQKALLSVNRELLILYWNIGNIILKFQDKEGWGSKVIDNISKEIKNEFPDLKGFWTTPPWWSTTRRTTLPAPSQCVPFL